MSCIRFDNFFRSELFYNVSGKDRIKDATMTELKSNLTAQTEQTKFFQSKMNFIEKNYIEF